MVYQRPLQGPEHCCLWLESQGGVSVTTDTAHPPSDAHLTAKTNTIKYNIQNPTNLPLCLFSRLQRTVSPDQAESLKLPVLHAARQEEVEREGHILSMPAACHLNIVFRIDP